jgi:hypothetical protein
MRNAELGIRSFPNLDFRIWISISYSTFRNPDSELEQEEESDEPDGIG